MPIVSKKRSKGKFSPGGENDLLRQRISEIASEMTVAGLAKASGIGKPLIYSYVSGTKSPAAANLVALANAAGVSLDWLAGRPGAPREYGDKGMLESVQAGIAEATGLVQVPVYEVEAGAGRLKLVESEDVKTWLWVARFWADRYGKANLSIIKASGDSMVPSIEPGSLILLNMADKSRAAGVRVVRIGDGLTVKRCDPRPRGGLHMASDNPGHEPFLAKAGEFEIIGAVLATIKVWE